MMTTVLMMMSMMGQLVSSKHDEHDEAYHSCLLRHLCDTLVLVAPVDIPVCQVHCYRRRHRHRHRHRRVTAKVRPPDLVHKCSGPVERRRQKIFGPLA